MYKCCLNKLCKSEIRLFYQNKDEKVDLYSNNIDHDHLHSDESEWGIPKKTKKAIEKLYTSGI